MKRTNEEYEKLSQREHVLKRPGMYVGEIKPSEYQEYVLSKKEEKPRKADVLCSKALHKIIDEVLVNAADNVSRSLGAKIKQTYIKVTLTDDSVEVSNDGAPVHLYKSQEYDMVSASMIFGQFLSGNNYDDQKRRTTGGMNGLGSKLTNVFSTRFIVVAKDHLRNKVFSQTFSENMKKQGKVKFYTPKKELNSSLTSIKFFPDFVRFGNDTQRFTEADRGLLRKRLLDLAFCLSDTKCNVYLREAAAESGSKFKKYCIRSAKDYAQLFVNGRIVSSKLNERWEVSIACAKEQTGSSHGFVNSICTPLGTHVNYVQNKLARKMLDASKQLRTAGVSSKQLKDSMVVFVKAIIENPTFKSQTKEELTTKYLDFSSSRALPDFSDKFVKNCLSGNTGIVDEVLLFAKAREERKMKRELGASTGRKRRLTGIKKLQDANRAGTKHHSMKCKLVLCEGDSAATTAISGLSVVGRDYWGVFPLKGKLLNTRGASLKAVLGNVEIQSLLKILGLDMSKQSTISKSDLRYGKIVVMADQDVDGTHIKALVVNFIDSMFPSLIDDNFIDVFITPVLKMVPRRSGLLPQVFFSEGQYEEYAAGLGGQGEIAKQYRVKYYKGLGTSTSKEAREYFKDLDRHLKQLESPVPLASKDLFRMCFDKSKADDRKKWIVEHANKKGWYMDFNSRTIDYKDMINKELHAWAAYSLERAIPSLRDGLKQSQRKILFGCFKRNLTTEIKVAQLAAYVSEHSHYKHGEVSLNGAIVGMTQDFVGANNLNLLLPNGQLGTRLHGGGDAASPRYVFTQLNPLTRLIFKEEDEALLTFRTEEGYSIEPRAYSPIIPMILINGANGIASGWSTQIPNHSVERVVGACREWVENREGGALSALVPSYRGFTGTINPVSDGKWVTRGKHEWISNTKLTVSELPVGTWTEKWREFLQDASENGSKEIPKDAIVDVVNNSTDTKVSVTIELSEAFALKMRERRETQKTFRLANTLSFGNAHLLDDDGKVRKYKSAVALLNAWAPARLALYEERKKHLLAKWEKEAAVLQAKALFIDLVSNGTIGLQGKTKLNLEQEMAEHGIKTEHHVVCLGLHILSFTKQKMDLLNENKTATQNQIDEMNRLTARDLWTRDLDALVEALVKPSPENPSQATTTKKKKLKKTTTNKNSLRAWVGSQR